MSKKRRISNGRYGKSKRAERDVYEPEMEAKPVTKRIKFLKAKSENQQIYMDAINDHDIIFCLGEAGTGKSALAVSKAVQLSQPTFLNPENSKKIILVRPVVEVGETMGFLPGDAAAKMSPYLRPLYDELGNFYTPQEVKQLISEGQIEIATLQHMRGRTLKNSIIILDEAQNATKQQLKMFLTRLGEGSKMILTGDDKQTDLPYQKAGWFVYYANKYRNVEGVITVKLDASDIVRHPTVARLVREGLD